ncbi:uncharacterized protein LOC124685237 isoform X2 [Lolium rigidum]|uniref:uncharacterized protein LOC124685237 isoform X2 n=1 Tax=Lolium rigidum TaxID=89674 RepID=UPI001F5CCD03|nr:uncharacterized protein LOC124685237 isoform X2 [Lolium rigidum]
MPSGRLDATPRGRSLPTSLCSFLRWLCRLGFLAAAVVDAVESAGPHTWRTFPPFASSPTTQESTQGFADSSRIDLCSSKEVWRPAPPWSGCAHPLDLEWSRFFSRDSRSSLLLQWKPVSVAAAVVVWLIRPTECVLHNYYCMQGKQRDVQNVTGQAELD